MKQSDDPVVDGETDATELGRLRSSLVDVANALWSLNKRLNSEYYPDIVPPKLEMSISQIERALESNGIQVIDLSGRDYDEGLAVEILSVEGPDDKNLFLSITEMVRPIILVKEKIVQSGQVLIKRVRRDES